MDTQQLNSALFSRFKTQNAKLNFKVSKLNGLGFFPPSLKSLLVSEMVADTYVGGNQGKLQLVQAKREW